jgi:putative membrane protein
MHTTGIVLAAVVAVIHVYIFILESFLWTTRHGRRAFGLDEAQAAATKALAQNQGVYNLLLAAGIVWGLSSGTELVPRVSFFLAAVAVVGVVGGLTASRRILFVQTVPAVVALVVVTSIVLCQ